MYCKVAFNVAVELTQDQTNEVKGLFTNSVFEHPIFDEDEDGLALVCIITNDLSKALEATQDNENIYRAVVYTSNTDYDAIAFDKCVLAGGREAWCLGRY